MERDNVKEGDTVYIRPGVGFWDVTSYPIGACFDRAGHDSMPVKVEGFYALDGRDRKGCNTFGTIETGGTPEKVAFDLALCDAEPVKPEPTPEVKKAGCMYQIWDRKAGALVDCGETAGDMSLCDEHRAFVKDCTVGPFTKSKRRAPVELTVSQAVHAMQKAYGFTSSFSGAFPLGKPSDAGKAPINPISRAEYQEWSRRLTYQSVDGAECCHLPAFWTRKPEAPEIVEAEKPDGYQTFDGETVPYITVTEPGQVAGALEKLERIEAAEKAHEPAGQYTREEIEAACVKLMEERDTYRGTGIPGVLWNVGFRLVYQKRAGSDAQIAFIRALIAKKPEKYAPLLV